MRHPDKEYRKLIEELVAVGWTVDRTKSGHWQVKAPDGVTMLVFPSTPSDHRAILNARADVRRALRRIAEAAQTPPAEKKKKP